jgi:hypothetical protein
MLSVMNFDMMGSLLLLIFQKENIRRREEGPHPPKKEVPHASHGRKPRPIEKSVIPGGVDPPFLGGYPPPFRGPGPPGWGVPPKKSPYAEAPGTPRTPPGGYPPRGVDPPFF